MPSAWIIENPQRLLHAAGSSKEEAQLIMGDEADALVNVLLTRVMDTPSQGT